MDKSKVKDSMITLGTIQLPEELRWVDEFTWTRQSSQVDFTIAGKAIIYSSAYLNDATRPITLKADDAWIDRTTLESLFQLAKNELNSYTLTLNDGRSFVVVFRFWEKPVIEVSPVQDTAFPNSDTYYKLTLKLGQIV